LGTIRSGWLSQDGITKLAEATLPPFEIVEADERDDESAGNWEMALSPTWALSVGIRLRQGRSFPGGRRFRFVELTGYGEWIGFAHQAVALRS
jgi:hypothetical protein